MCPPALIRSQRSSSGALADPHQVALPASPSSAARTDPPTAATIAAKRIASANLAFMMQPVRSRQHASRAVPRTAIAATSDIHGCSWCAAFLAFEPTDFNGNAHQEPRLAFFLATHVEGGSSVGRRFLEGALLHAAGADFLGELPHGLFLGGDPAPHDGVVEDLLSGFLHRLEHFLSGRLERLAHGLFLGRVFFARLLAEDAGEHGPIGDRLFRGHHQQGLLSRRLAEFEEPVVGQGHGLAGLGQRRVFILGRQQESALAAGADVDRCRRNSRSAARCSPGSCRPP